MSFTRKILSILIVLILVFQFSTSSNFVNAVSNNATTAATWKERRQEKLQEIKEERERILEEIQETKEQASEAARTKRLEFKEKLAEIKDARKKLVIERLDFNLAFFNEKWINHWNRVLDRLRQLLTKIETRTDKAEEAGLDVTQVREAIVAANQAIEDAQEAGALQAGKTYVIEGEDEENLGQDVSSEVQELKSDLKVTKDLVVAARNSVRDALKSLKGLAGVNDLEEEE